MKKTFAFIVVPFLFFLSFPAVSIAASALAAYVEPDGSVQYFMAWNISSKGKAEKDVMKECRADPKAPSDKNSKLKCRLVISDEGPGYLSVFHASNGAFGAGYHSNRQESINRAYQECAKRGECPETAHRVHEDSVAGGGGKKIAATPKTKQCSPPAGRAVKSRTSCFNGDCVREFENGCIIRFQAAYCHNPFNGNWEWKPDGC